MTGARMTDDVLRPLLYPRVLRDAATAVALSVEEFLVTAGRVAGFLTGNR